MRFGRRGTHYGVIPSLLPPHIVTLGIVSEADSALTITLKTVITRTLGIVSETDAPITLHPIKQLVAGNSVVKRSPLNGTNGTALTISNGGGDNFQNVVIAGASNTFTYDSSIPPGAAKADVSHSTGNAYLEWSFAASYQVKTSMVYWRTALPANDTIIASVIASGTTAAQLQLTASGKLRIIKSGGSVVSPSGTVTVATNTWVRIEVDWTGDAVNGFVTVRLFNTLGNTTPDETFTAGPIGTAGLLNTLRFGNFVAAILDTPWWIRDVSVQAIPQTFEADAPLALSHSRQHVIGPITGTLPPATISTPWVGTPVLGNVAASTATSGVVDISGATTGQVVFVGGLLGDAQTGAVTVPGGWTKVPNAEGSEGTSGGSSSRSFVAYRVKQAGDTTFTFSWPVSCTYQLIPFSYPNVDPANPVNLANYAAYAGGAFASGSLTPTLGGAWAAGLFGANGNASAIAITPATGLTERAEGDTTTSRFVDLELADTNGVVSGAQSYTATITGSTASHGGVNLLILSPTPGAPGTSDYPQAMVPRKVKTLGIVSETDSPLTATRVHTHRLHRVTSATIGSIVGPPWVGTIVLGNVAGTTALSGTVDISGAPDGQVVFVGGLLEDAQVNPVHLPTGWLMVPGTEGSEGTPGSANAGSRSFVAWRLKQPGDSTFTFSWDNIGKYQLIPFSYAGTETDSDNVVDLANYAAATGSTTAATSITNIFGTNRWIVGLYGKRGTTAAMALTPDAALTERAEADTSASRFLSLELADTNGTVSNGAHNYTATVTGSTASHGGSNSLILPPGLNQPADVPLAVTRVHSKTLGIVSEADSALTITYVHGGSSALGEPSETDSALTLTRQKLRTLGIVSETDAAQTITRRKNRAAGIVSETDAAQTMTRQKLRTPTTVSETDTALTITKIDPILRTLGQVSETDTAQTTTRRKVKTLGIVSETDSALTTGRVKNRAVGLVSEADAALTVNRQRAKALGEPTETDTALTDTRRKLRTLGIVSETDTALTITKIDPILRVLGLVSETDAAQTITRDKTKTLGIFSEADSALHITRGAASHPVGIVSEADSALTMNRVKTKTLGQVSETDSVLSDTRRKIKTLGIVSETDVAQTINRARSKTLGEPSETDTALTITKVDPILRVLGTVSEVDSALTTSRVKRTTLGEPTEVDSPLADTRDKRKTLGIVSEVDSVLADTRRKSRTLGEPSETDSALTITKVDPILRVLGTVTEVDTALTITTHGKHAVNQVSEVDSVLALSHTKVKVLGLVSETDSALTTTRDHSRVLGTVAEVDSALTISIPSRHTLGLVSESDSALTTTRVKRKTLGTVAEVDTTLAASHRKVKTLNQVSELDTAQTITRVKVHSTNQATETDAALTDTRAHSHTTSALAETDTALHLSETRIEHLNQVTETDTSQQMLRVKRITLGTIHELDTATSLRTLKDKTLGLCVEADQVLPIPPPQPPLTEHQLSVRISNERLLNVITSNRRVEVAGAERELAPRLAEERNMGMEQRGPLLVVVWEDS